MLLPCWKCGAPPTPLPAIDEPPTPPAASSPDLTRLITSNEAPLDAEIRFLRAIVAEGQQQADALNAQIADFQAILTQLGHKRDEIVEDVRRHSFVLAPVRSVPLELLCEIFALTLAGDDTTPWYLGQICRSWRFSALACPSLWTSITLPNTTHSILPLQLFPKTLALRDFFSHFPTFDGELRITAFGSDQCFCRDRLGQPQNRTHTGLAF
ncbi:hypothetical protein DFH06DRAFT_1107313 [Mycena polygramma]|nr:hypothetical protein DFH06DRAFT_1107313 [Mycena polygramma]